jgi:hypothetical protein
VYIERTLGFEGIAVSMAATAAATLTPDRRFALEGGPAVVETNRKPHGELPIASDWRPWLTRVDGAAVRDGINEVVIRWPPRRFTVAAAIEAAAGDLLAGGAPEFYPVFAEIHSFTASASVPLAAVAYETSPVEQPS